MKLLKKALSAFAALAMCTAFFVNSAAPADIITAAGTVRDMTSQEVVSDMGLGWNLGNSFDSYYKGQTMSPSAVETACGNPTVTKELIQAIKNEGFKTIRIPVTWMNCIDSSNNINEDYMKRVQEVVDYCINEGLYVILNVHHDGGSEGGWLRNAQNDYTNVSAKYQKIWEQIASNFADYSDYLIFESMNEVGFNTSGNPTSENYKTLNSLNQLFVNTIRNSGSNNEKRHLLIAGYFTDTNMTCDNRFEVPNDPAGRCIVSIHYYSPSAFCVAEPSSTWSYSKTWGTADEQEALEADLDLLKTRFVNAGIPVIIGEYGVLTESENGKDKASIVTYLKSVAEGALQRGICPILWDSGNGGVLLGFNVYSDATSWGGVYKGIQAPFLGQNNGQVTKYTFDAENEESVDPKEIMYDGQTMTFSINWTYPGTYKDKLSLGGEVILYFDGAEQITTTTTNPLETKFEERVTAVVDKEVNEEEGIDRPTMRIDISPYKGNKLVGVKFNMTGTHGDGNGALSYNLVDETAESGTKWAYTAFDFKSANDDIYVSLASDVTENLSYDFLSFNIWYEKDGKTSADYSFNPDVTLYFEDEVVIQTTPAATTTTGGDTTTTVTTTADVPSSDETIDSELVTRYGDVNCDESVNIADVIAINMYLLDNKSNPLTDVGIANSDVVRDGEINTSDSLTLMNYVAMVVDESKLGA